MRWWTTLPLGDGHERSLQLGPLALRLARLRDILRVAHRDEDDDRPDVALGEPGPIQDVDEAWRVERFAGVPASDPRLVPLTATRSVVSRPEVPLVVLPGAELDVYVSTPLWLGVVLGDVTVVDMPLRAPKPTFFGTPTQGTVAWAMRTLLRVDRSKIEPRPHRAITPVQIHNAGDDPLRVERLQIPVQRLSVHADAEDRLWTQTIVLHRRQGQEHAQVEVGAPGPGPALGPPRERSGPAHPVLHVFNAVFT